MTLYRARGFLFLYDDWDYVLDARKWTLPDFFQPHNEHWSTIPQLLFRLVVSTDAGVRSYIPYEACLLVAHGAAALLLFGLVRRRSGDLVALAAAALLVVLGRGFDNILWAFQVSFTGSVALGLLALWLLDRPGGLWRPITASLALLASLMCSGVGPLMVLLVGIELVLGPRRRLLWVLILPSTSFIIWFLVFGKKGVAGDPYHFTMTDLPVLAAYIPKGMGAAAAGVFSLTPDWSGIALSVFIGIVSAAFWKRPRDPRLIAAVCTLIAMYALTGYERVKLGAEQAASSRYIYVGGMFVLLALTTVVGDLPRRRYWLAVLALPTLLGLAGSGIVLDQWVNARRVLTRGETVRLQMMAHLCKAPDLDGTGRFAAEAAPSVTAQRYCSALGKFGHLVPRASLADLRRHDPVIYDDVLQNVLTTRLRLDGAPYSKVPTGCRAVETVTALEVRSGASLLVRSVEPEVPVQVFLYSAGGPPPIPSALISLPAGNAVIRVPDGGEGIMWQVHLVAPAFTHVSECGVLTR